MLCRLPLYVFILMFSLQGCAYFSGFPLFNTKQRTAGPEKIFQAENFESLDLAKILGQAGMTAPVVSHKGDGKRRSFPLPYLIENERDLQVSIDGDRKAFRDYDLLGVGSKSGALVVFKSVPANDSEISFFFIPSGKPAENETDLVGLYTDFERRFTNDSAGLLLMKRARNSIQERILAASNSRCLEYKTFLMQFESEGNFFWGAASIITGGLGAIFTPAATARALAGVAGITGGMRAEWQQDYFHKLTTQVIMNGIEAKRLGLYTKILEKQATKSYEDYTVMAAINDAVRYHGACSLVDGLQEAGDAVRQTQDVGFIKLQEYLKAAGMKASPLNLLITPSHSAALSVDTPLAFTATGGTGKATFSLQGDTSGGAVIDPVSGLFNAGSKTGTFTVIATDQAGIVAGVPVTINPKFEFDSPPPPPPVAKSTPYDIAVKGGTPPYTFTMKQNKSGSPPLLQALPLSSNKIHYVSGALTGDDIIEATDSSTIPQTIVRTISVP